MKAIWKYILSERVSEIQIPKEAMIVLVREQNEEVCIWTEVNPDAEKETRTFIIFGTGTKILENEPGQLLYRGTAMLAKGALVWHVYEKV